jgi:hypothetical protein
MSVTDFKAYVATEYVDLDPTTAADLVLRAKAAQTHAAPAPAPPPPAYPNPPQQYRAPPNYGFQSQRPPPQQVGPPSTNPTDLSRIISGLSRPGSGAIPSNSAAPSNVDLSRIVAGINNQHADQPPSSTGITPDVARLLGQINQAPQAAPYGGPPPQYSMPGSYQGTPAPVPAPIPSASASILPPTSQTSPDIQQLLANLTSYKPPS